jgi:UDP-glucuronate decarboxylase
MTTFSAPADVSEIVERISDIAPKLSGKKVLFSGGRGFLGRYFVEVFVELNRDVLEHPVEVVVLDNLITAGELGAKTQDYPHVTFVKHDVIQPFTSDINFDYVVHAAGIASPFYYRAHPLETLEVAITGTKNLLELARDSNAQLTFFSSSEIYGDPDPRHVPMQESYRGNVSSQGPRACYDESKRVGETLCYIFHEYFGVHTNIIRPFNVYGPGMQESDYRVLPNFGSRLKADKPFNVYGTGNQTRTFCYLTDAMVGFLRVILSGVPGETYNIGNPKPEISVMELIDVMARVIGRPIERNVIDYPDSYPADEPLRRCPDIRKAKLQLGYEPQVKIEDGLERFLNWTGANYTGDA